MVAGGCQQEASVMGRAQGACLASQQECVLCPGQQLSSQGRCSSLLQPVGNVTGEVRLGWFS